MRMPAGCIRQDASPHGKGDSACLLPKPMKATIQLSAESILRDDILSGHKPSLAGDAALPRGSLSSCRCIDHTALNQTQSDNSLNTAIQSNNQKKHGFNRCNDQAIVGEHCEHGNGSFPPSLSSTGISSTYEDLHLRSFTPMDACSVDSDSDNTHHKHPLFHCGSAVDQGTRRTMEDQHTMLSEGIPFFGVYDGHGGTQCAEYLRDNLHQMILSHTEIKTNPEKAIYDGITEADRLFLQRSEVETNESGSVCAVALILDDVLVVGNVGDCEAVLSRRGAPVVLTKKHNLQSNPAEMQRLKDAGGKIFHNRVGHPKFNPSVVSLAVTRAIGDAGFKLDEYTDGKPSGVIAEPDTSSTKLTHEDEFLIIGCDGLWDVMTYEEVVEACSRLARTLDPSADVSAELSELLLQEALLQGSSDNITVIVVELNIPKNHRCSCSDSG